MPYRFHSSLPHSSASPGRSGLALLLRVGSCCLLGLCACSAGSSNPAPGTGGTNATGGATAAGANTGSGGGLTGGAAGTGGQAAGGTASGGTTAGGKTSTGGAGTGGAAPTGGASSTGGSTHAGATGGGNSGGSAGSGGSQSGGASATGGAGSGGSSAGGAATGGTSAGGAATGGGGAGDWKGATCATFGSSDIPTLFTTDYATWKSARVKECGTGLARVTGCQGDNNTCSEGMGYGMLLAVAANDQATFDKLNAFRKALTEVNNATDTSSGKVMAWLSQDTCPPTASGGNANSATDGDLDAAMSLVQAAARWPGGAYLDEAKQYTEAIWKNQVAPDASRLKPGNLELSADSRDYISYYAPGYFHVFASVSGDPKWNGLADAFYTKLAEQQGKCTNGQVPDTFGASECKIWYDSCRAPWRIANDYGWFGDERAKAFLDALYAGSVQGKQASGWTDQNNSAMVGAFALSGASSDDATMQGLCDAWSSAQKDDTPYFQNTLRLLYLLTAGGLPTSGLGS
jgi:hypothetical protein